MKSAQVLISAVLAGLAGVIGTVWVMQPSEAVAVSSPAPSSPSLAGKGDAVAALGEVSLHDQEVAQVRPLGHPRHEEGDLAGVPKIRPSQFEVLRLGNWEPSL